jgi:hypothetical protein
MTTLLLIIGIPLGLYGLWFLVESIRYSFRRTKSTTPAKSLIKSTGPSERASPPCKRGRYSSPGRGSLLDF